jgi:photosystem II stability/assembly factor-like uncharacterized protein
MKNRFLIFFAISFLFTNVFGQTWENIGPGGGFFKDFVIHPTNPDIVYAGSDDGGGVWKTTNGGSSWSLLTGDYPNFTGWHIEMDIEHPDTLYFCELYGRYGVLKTTDGGLTLEEQTDGFIFNKDFQTTQLAIFPGDGDTLFASTGEGGDFGRIGNGVFSSYNGGETWNYSGLQSKSVHCIKVIETGRLFAGSDEHGLWYSDDVGENWILHPDVPDTASIVQLNEKNGVLIASGSIHGVYISFDNGATFANIGLVGEFNFEVEILSTSPHVELIATGFLHPNRFTSETLLWTPITDPLLEDHLLIGAAAQDGLIYAGIFSDTQIIKSTDNGATWTQLENNPIATEIRSISVDPESDRIYASLQHSYNLNGDRYNKEVLALSTDAGETWTRKGPLAHGMELEMHPTETETIFLGTFAQGLFKTTDGFETWESARSGNKLILDVVIDPDNTDEMILSELDIPTVITGVYKSVDGGETWYNTGTVAATEIAYNTDNDEVYFSSENGIFLSTDNGETIGATPEFFEGEVVLSVIYESPFIYAGTEEGLLYKIDAAGTVEEISGDWNSEYPTEVRNIRFIDNSLIVGLNGAEQDTLHNLNGGVWQSIDGGATWVDLTDGLTNTNVFGHTGIAVSNDRQLLIGTYGQGIFKSDGLVLSLPEQRLDFNVPEIFPNPNNGNIQITAASEIESILITAMDGKLVYEINKVQANQFFVHQAQLEPGVYIVTIQVNGSRTAQQMVVE